MADDRAVGIDEEGLGIAVEPVEAAAHPAVVGPHRIGDPGLLHEGQRVDLGSRVSTPMNWMVEPVACSAWAVRANSGVSCRQGTHHEAKKLSTTG